MSTRALTAVAAAILLAPIHGMSRDTAGVAHPATVPSEILLKFREDTDTASRLQLLTDLGAMQVQPLGRTGALLVRLSTPTAAASIARHVDDPRLLYIEPNFVYEAALVPNEAWFSQQWALLNTGQNGGTPGADINGTAAWDLSTGSPSVVIAILDSGIDRTHPDLVDNLYVNPGEIPDNHVDDDGNGFIDDVQGWDFVSEDNDPQDDNGHGTLGAGIAGAMANNGMGIAGVAWRVSLLPLKFLDANGSGSTANAVRALDYAVSLGVPITNNSWGGGGYSQALLDAILAAQQAGVVFVTSAGGSSTNLDDMPRYPASYDASNVLVVAATDHDDQLSSSSSYGARTVDLAAPGVDILTTYVGSTYFTMSGTSAATAHVSGALALVLSRYPGTTGFVGAMHLLTHVEKLPSLAGLVLTEGRLDAYAPLVEVPTHAPGHQQETAGPPLALHIYCVETDPEGVLLGLVGSASEPMDLDVYDIRGRHVRSLLRAAYRPGFSTQHWDGHGDDGIRAARGVYIARLRSPSLGATTRIALLQ